MRIGIIGGGAAGMMCAATINESMPEAEVFLIEKNDILGKKVLISGGNRCNVTTGISDIKEVLKKYPRGEKFLISSFHSFSPDDVRAWFEDHGVPLKCEDDLRVFPVSDNGHDVVGAFESVFKKHSTNILFKHNVQRIERNAQSGMFTVVCKDKPPLEVDKVVLSLGGQAYRHTGSTGDGYSLAESLGHHTTPLAASLNSFITLEKWPRQLAGLSFEEATISAGRIHHHSFTGPFLFTHIGISGPAVFALSSLVAFEEYGPKNPLPLQIDVVPRLSGEACMQQIKQSVRDNPKKLFKNTIHEFVSRSLSEIIVREIGVEEKNNAEVSNAEIEKAYMWLKHLPLHAVGRGAGDEFVTAGGIELTEVDPTTLESKIVPGLYFAGEILNVDGFTGGFNLQASWATGRKVGEHISG